MDTGVLISIISIIIGIGAVLMAVSPLAQMLWGRPKLEFEFVEFTGTDNKNLIFSVKNQPVTNALLRRIGVRREIGEINATINILEQGTNVIKAMQVPAMINDPIRRRADYVASCRPHLHAAFAVVHCIAQGPSIFDPRIGDHGAFVALPPGHYHAVIQVMCGDQHYQRDKLFRADADPVHTNWL